MSDETTATVERPGVRADETKPLGRPVENLDTVGAILGDIVLPYPAHDEDGDIAEQCRELMKNAIHEWTNNVPVADVTLA